VSIVDRQNNDLIYHNFTKIVIYHNLKKITIYHIYTINYTIISRFDILADEAMTYKKQIVKHYEIYLAYTHGTVASEILFCAITNACIG